MLNNRRVVVVLPAYNAAKTLEKTYAEIPLDVVDNIILVDDKSQDDTPNIAKRLNIQTIVHTKNAGYGGNQKTCYKAALDDNADIVVMLHPDYQYSPRLLVALAAMIAYGEYDAVLGSRIIAQSATRGGMPLYKYISNRFLTLAQNLIMGQKFSEYHTGYRAFSRKVLESLPLNQNSNDFVFDNEMIAQILYFGFKMGELSCPTRYEKDSSSISLKRSIKYGIGVLIVSIKYLLHKNEILKFLIFTKDGK